ncbi:MAG: hypothetical protein ACKOEV_14400 [Cytophagales bacterium]
MNPNRWLLPSFIARLFAWLMKYSPLESPNHTPSITQSHRKREAPLRKEFILRVGGTHARATRNTNARAGKNGLPVILVHLVCWWSSAHAYAQHQQRRGLQIVGSSVTLVHLVCW